jgi:hypothetical protein
MIRFVQESSVERVTTGFCGCVGVSVPSRKIYEQLISSGGAEQT